jgi:uncharacterized membrane protein
MEGLIFLSLGERVALAMIDLLKGTPPWLIVMIIAAFPIVELRGAIPVALLTLDMTWQQAVPFAILGNMLPIPFILWLLGPVSRFLSRWQLFDRFFRWLFARTLRRSAALERTETVGLILFVAIPLPITGGWTGSVAAYLLGFPIWRSTLFIFIGVCIASVVVTLLTLGTIGVVGLFG